MRWILAANDGGIQHTTDAPDAGQAFEQLAKHLNYPSFAAFSADLGYTPGDFQIAAVEVEERQYDPDGNRIKIEQQRAGIVKSAFKHLRRLGQ